MDDKTLIALANDNIAVEGEGGALRITGTERYSTIEVNAEYDGHSVRVEFTDTDTNPREYRYNAAVYDAETGELITIGNGAKDWDVALSIVQWGKLRNHWA